MAFALCTIIAKNYLAAARVLCASWRQHHPDAECHVLIVDDFAGYVDPAKEDFHVVTLRELALPDPKRFCFKYSVVELCTAVKPFLMEHLLRTGGEALDGVVYLDPDILVTAPLDEPLAGLAEHDVLLTPHLDLPGEGPVNATWGFSSEDLESHILRHGAFNLGFLAVSARPGGHRFLAWFRERLADRCVTDYGRGLFVDQKFIDLAVSIFPSIGIVRDPGCNAASWNAATRNLSRDSSVPAGASEGWQCNGRPLRFFHFSSYRPDRTRLPGEPARFEDRADVRELFSHYGKQLLAADYEKTRLWPYGFHAFRDGGPPIPDDLRRHYRDALSRGTATASDPFGSRGLARLAPLCQTERWLRHKFWRVGWRVDRLLARWTAAAAASPPTGSHPTTDRA